MARNEHRTVEDLRRTAEQTRAELTGTMEQLRSRVSETVTDLQDRISPDAIKAEVGEYVRSRGDMLAEKARQNPLAATAIAAGLAYPLFGLVRSIPGPVVLIGSGLFLLGTPSGRKVNAVAKDFSAQALDQADAARRRLHDARDLAAGGVARATDAAGGAMDALKHMTSDGASQVVDAAAGLTGAASRRLGELHEKRGAQVMDAAAGLAGAASRGLGELQEKGVSQAGEATRAIRESAMGAAAAVRDATSAAADYGADAAGQLKTRAMAAPRRVSDALNATIRENPLLVGGVALGAGMLLASALPRSDIERTVAGGVVDAAKFRAADLASQGLEAAKDAAAAIISEVAERAHHEGLDASGRQGPADDLRHGMEPVAETATTAALERSSQDTATPDRLRSTP